MIKEQLSDPLWSGNNKSMSSKSMSDIKVLKEQAKKDRQKKAAAQAAAQSYRFSNDIKFDLKPRQDKDESFLSKSVKHVLGDFGAFAKSAIRGKDYTHLYLGLDNTVPGTPEVKEFELDNPFDLLKPKNGINHQHLKNLVSTVQKNGKTAEFVEPKILNPSGAKKPLIKQKPPRLKMQADSENATKTPNKIESILKEMTQGLPPPLTDIETPGKAPVSNKFTFPKTVKTKEAEIKPLDKHTIVAKNQHSSKLENLKETKTSKLLTAANGSQKLLMSPNQEDSKLSSSSASSSDDSSSDSSGSSDSEDEQPTKSQVSQPKQITSLTLKSPLLQSIPSKSLENGSPLNNNYLLDKSIINGPTLQDDNHGNLSYTELAPSLNTHKVMKGETSLIDTELNLLDPWELEKPLESPLDNGLFAEILSIPGPEGENFSDDIFKPCSDLDKELNVEPLLSHNTKRDIFEADSVFSSEFDSNLPTPCLPRRGSLYRKDSEQTDGRNKSSSKSNETKDKLKSKSTRIDSSFPSVKVNSGSIGHSCLTKAQLKMPIRRKSVSESSNTSIEDSKTSSRKSKEKLKQQNNERTKKEKNTKKERTKGKVEPKPSDSSKNKTSSTAKSKSHKNHNTLSVDVPAPKISTDFKEEKAITEPVLNLAEFEKNLLNDLNVGKLISPMTSPIQRDLQPLLMPPISHLRKEPQPQLSPLTSPIQNDSQPLLISMTPSVLKDSQPLLIPTISPIETDLETPQIPTTSPARKESQPILFLRSSPNQKDSQPLAPEVISAVTSDVRPPLEISQPPLSLSLSSFPTDVCDELKQIISPVKDLLSPIRDLPTTFNSEAPNVQQDVKMDTDEFSLNSLENGNTSPVAIDEEEQPPLMLSPADFQKDITEPGSFTQLKAEVQNESPNPQNCFDAFQQLQQDSIKKLIVRIPLHMIKMRLSTIQNCENNRKASTSMHKNISLEKRISPSFEEEEIDVEELESPVKRKRTLSNQETHSEYSNNIFKSPIIVNPERLVVRINLSRLKRQPTKKQIDNEAISKVIKPNRGRPPKKHSVSSEPTISSFKMETISGKEELTLTTTIFDTTQVKEESDLTSTESTPNSSNSSDKRRKRGRPPKEMKPQIKVESESEAKLSKPSFDLKKHVVVEPKQDSNICHECGTLRKDLGKDPKKLASYKNALNAYLNEGRRTKHVADGLPDPVERAHTYIEAVLNYVQYLICVESSGKIATKNGTDDYSKTTSECIRLVDYVITRYGQMQRKDKYDRRFVFLCLRLQSVLYLKLFNVKKDSAMKYGKVLSEYYKQYKPVGNTGPSPYYKPAQTRGSTGTPSPSSPSPGPSPGGSVASVGSAGSSGSAGSNDKITNGGSFITIPSDMHEKSFNYVQYTKYLLHGHKLWDDAENLTAHSPVFMSNLSKTAGILSMQSSLLHIVEYTKAGLKIIKETPLS